MEKPGRGPQEDAVYQISKLYTFQFQRRRMLKMASLSQCSNLWGGASFDKLGRGLKGDAL